ncbi:hypothetical protein PVAND_001788 [Polypedilum vanderplanki]|uniref:Uncharacterized protein n=1 Tax=Polypedilum vanderplanki TaxID=319348 RepID=A0A9J6BQA1_POLVA|nr:hypothetical protein PVAND_001788 [Polypedilum vanderplanki]
MKTCKSSTQACDNNNQFISLFFFENGSSCKPDKLRIRKNDIEHKIEKMGKSFMYQDKIVYTLKGDPVMCSTQFSDNSAFVLVKPMDKFMRARYDDVMKELMSKLCSRPSDLGRNKIEKSCYAKSQSMPTVCAQKAPIPECARQPQVSECARAPQPSCGRAIQPNYAPPCPLKTSECNSTIQCSRKPKPVPVCCTPSESEEETEEDLDCPCDEPPRFRAKNDPKKNTKGSQNVAPAVQKKKRIEKSTAAKCCPCFIKHRKCIPRPESTCGNTKRTQTTKDDFKISIAKLKKAKRDERKRMQSYASSGRYKKTKQRQKPMYCPIQDGIEGCDDAKTLKKYEIAREKFFQKRIEVEEKLAKKLEVKYRDEFCSETEDDEE